MTANQIPNPGGTRSRMTYDSGCDCPTCWHNGGPGHPRPKAPEPDPKPSLFWWTGLTTQEIAQ